MFCLVHIQCGIDHNCKDFHSILHILTIVLPTKDILLFRSNRDRIRNKGRSAYVDFDIRRLCCHGATGDGKARFYLINGIKLHTIQITNEKRISI